MEKMTIIKVDGLTKSFVDTRGKHEVLKELSLSLYKGEILGLVGESGSGKTTLARILTGLLPYTKGTIRLYGQELSQLQKKERKSFYQKLQMVFQNPNASFDPKRTLGDGIGESLRNQGYSKAYIKEQVENTLAQCGLSAEYADRYPHEVSGGQCQRAAIARALIVAPEVLILDEATSALDATVQGQLLELLGNLKRQHNLTILCISHSLTLVESFCQRVVVMKEGQIVEEGPVAEVLRHPKEAYTKALVEANLEGLYETGRK